MVLDVNNFKEGMNEVNRKLRLAKSEFDSSAARVKAFGKSQDELHVQADSLNRRLDLQEQKVKMLSQRYQEVAGQTGRHSKESELLATQLHRAKLAQTEMEGALMRTQKALDGTAATAKKFNRELFQVHDEAIEAGIALGVMSAALAVAFGSTIVKAADFESQLSNLKAVTNASADEMEQLRNQALEMGAATKYSASEAAEAQTELAKAGLTTTQILNGGLSGALALASAGEIELSEAAKVASTVLNAFRKDNLSVAEAADILAGAAAASATDVKEMSQGLSQVSAVAASAGLSFRDTATALAVFAQNGIKGSDAGTSLKTMLLNLTPSSKEAEAEMRKLGLITKKNGNLFFDAQGHVKSFADVSEILHKKLGKLTDEQRNLALKTMFGTDAVRAANIAFTAGAEGVRTMNRELSKTTAAQISKTKMDNLKGTIEELKGSFETLQIQMGSAFLPTVRNLAQGMKGIVDWFGKLSPTTKEAIGVFVGTTAAVLGFGAAVAGVIAIANPFVGAVVGIGVAVGGIAATFHKANEDMRQTEENTRRFGIGVSEGTRKAADGFLVLRDQAIFNLSQLRSASGAEAKKVVDETVAIFSQMGNKIVDALNKSKVDLQRVMAGLLAELPGEVKPAIDNIEKRAKFTIDAQTKQILDSLKVVHEGLNKFQGDTSKMSSSFAAEFKKALNDLNEGARVFVQKMDDLNSFMGKIQEQSGKISADGAKKFVRDIESTYEGAKKAAQDWAVEQRKTIEQLVSSKAMNPSDGEASLKAVEYLERQRIATVQKVRAEGLTALESSLSQEALLVNVKTGEMLETWKQYGNQAVPVPAAERLAEGKALWSAYFDDMRNKTKESTDAAKQSYDSMVTDFNEKGLLLRESAKVDLTLEGMGTATSFANGLKAGSVSVNSVAAQLGLDISSGVQVDLGSEGKHTVQSLVEGLQSGKIGVSTFIVGVQKLLKTEANLQLTPEGQKTMRTYQGGLQSGSSAINRLTLGLSRDVKANLSFDASSVGSNISRSMAGGIASGRSSVINSAIDIARSALSKMKSVLGINSPSKEFMKIGAGVSEGFALGMIRNVGIVQNAAVSLSKAAEPMEMRNSTTSISSAQPSPISTIQPSTHITINHPVIREEQDIQKLVAEVERAQSLKLRSQGVVNVGY